MSTPLRGKGVGAVRRGLAAILVAVLIVAVAAPPAEACLECVALGLASFAVFTQLVSAITAPRVVYTAPAYSVAYAWPYAPAVAAAPFYPVSYAPVSYAVPSQAVAVAPAPQGAWNGPRVVQYPHGRYELRGDGVTVAWAWVWIPAVPAPVVAPAVPVPDGPEGQRRDPDSLTAGRAGAGRSIARPRRGPAREPARGRRPVGARPPG